MPVSYSIHESEQILYVACFGELTIREVDHYFAQINVDDSIPPGCVEIVDLTDVSYFSLNSNEALTMPGNYAAAQAKHQIRATIPFGANPANQGFLLLIQTYFNRELPEHFFRIAKDLDEAKTMAQAVLED